ncbi:MAG: hypothetical protein LBU35_02350 [Holosporales bacterium]|jgi:hypothetical protein|nr:hypothetical protein [Holosporales bacterium]
MNILYKSLAIITLTNCVFCSNAEFKAGVDPAYKERERYGFGSLIKDKGAILNGVFHKKETESEEKKDTLKVKKIINSSKKEDSFEKAWTALTKVLSEFPIESMNKLTGEARTELVNIESFDNTGTCKYQLFFEVSPNGKFSVRVKSKEDSEIRIKKLKEIIENKIKEHIEKP